MSAKTKWMLAVVALVVIFAAVAAFAVYASHSNAMVALLDRAQMAGHVCGSTCVSTGT